MPISDADLLSAAMISARTRRPYFSVGFAAMVRRFAPVGTMAISDDNVLLVDPGFLQGIGAKNGGEFVTHELLHILRRHPARASAIPNVDRSTWNQAADLEINDDLDLNLLPEGVLHPAREDLPVGLTAEEYYARLKQEQQKQGGQGDQQDAAGGALPNQGSQGQPQAPSPTAGKPSSQDGPGAAGGKPPADVTKGRCGSGAGGEPIPGEAELKGTAKGRTHSDMERMRRDVATSIVEAAKRQGNVPGGILRMAEGELQPPKVRWEQKLRRSIRNSVATTAGKLDYSRVRPNRRQAMFDETARVLGGRSPIMPALVSPKPAIAIGIDTSGSMGREDLLRAISEARAVLRTIGSPVMFLACDAECTEPIKVNAIQKLVANLRGGGGTDFRPIFDAVSKLRPRPTTFIFLTDGMGPAPKTAPMGFETIWGLIGRGAKAPVTWGTQIAIEHDQKSR